MYQKNLCEFKLPLNQPNVGIYIDHISYANAYPTKMTWEDAIIKDIKAASQVCCIKPFYFVFCGCEKLKKVLNTGERVVISDASNFQNYKLHTKLDHVVALFKPRKDVEEVAYQIHLLYDSFLKNGKTLEVYLSQDINIQSNAVLSSFFSFLSKNSYIYKSIGNGQYYLQIDKPKHAKRNPT